jgi:hypothetical protein
MGFLVKEWTCKSGSYTESLLEGESKTEADATKVIFQRRVIADRVGEQRCWSIVQAESSEKDEKR